MTRSLVCFTCNGLITLNNSNILIHTNFVVSKFDILFILMGCQFVRTFFDFLSSNFFLPKCSQIFLQEFYNFFVFTKCISEVIF